MDDSAGAEQSSRPMQMNEPKAHAAEVERIQQLLKAKDDTSRFVGLALLKSTLDNSPEVQNDKEVITSLWNSISPKFLDRLLRTGSRPGSGQNNAKDMLDLVVAVLYTFAALLPDETRSDSKLIDRIPKLVEAILQSSGETTELIIKTLLTLVSSPEGGKVFAQVEDWSPLVEMAPKQPLVLSIFHWSWLQGAVTLDYRITMRQKIDSTISALAASFRGTDGVTLLDFLDKVLGRLDDDLIPPNPNWLKPITAFIQGLVTSRPTAAGREAYITCAARILMVYLDTAPHVLFSYTSGAEKPFSFLFISLVIIDIRASLPTLLEKLNSPEYPAISNRLTAALVVLSSFVTFLVQQMEALESQEASGSFATTFFLTPDHILKLNKSIAETISLIIEYLRDRWDAAIAGAQGLHPEARIGESHTDSGSHRTLAWDSKHESVTDDPLFLNALRLLGVWLREDDGEALKKEASSLMDLLMDFYETHAVSGSNGVIHRGLVIGVLEGILQTDDGIQSLLDHNGWSVFSQDLLAILNRSSFSSTPECDLGRQIAMILSILADSECQSATPEQWLDFVTGVAAYSVPVDEGIEAPTELQGLWAEVLQVAAKLLVHSPPGVQRRFVHSAGAVAGIATVVREKIERGSETQQQVDDVIATLRGDAVFGV